MDLFQIINRHVPGIEGSLIIGLKDDDIGALRGQSALPQ